MGNHVVYGPGGFDASKPNNNAVVTETLPDNPLVANADAIRAKAQQAFTANAAFLAAVKPGTAAAQASQAYDQTVRLTREWNALARLVLGLLDDVSDT